MKKTISLISATTFLCCILSMSVAGDSATITYTDDIISFNYSAPFNANIKFIETDGNTHYSITTNQEDEHANGFVLIAIRNLDIYEGKELPWKDYIAPLESSNEYTVQVLNDNDNREVYIEYNDGKTPSRYCKILDFGTDKFAFVNYTLSADEECNVFLESIYESISVSDEFDINDYIYPEDTNSIFIYENLTAAE